MKNLLTTIFTILSLSLGAQYQYSVVVNGTLNLRSAPSVSSNIVASLQPFDLVIADLEYVDFIQKQLDATIALYKQPVLALIARSCKTDLPVFILSANNLPDGCSVEDTYHLFELSKEGGIMHKELARMGA